MKKQDNPVPSLDSSIKFKINNVLSRFEHYWNFREDKQSEIVESLFKELQNGVETNKEQPKEKDDYWMIYTKKEGFIETKFSTENAAIKKAKEIEGKNWERNTEFCEYNWVKPMKGYYNENSYQY